MVLIRVLCSLLSLVIILGSDSGLRLLLCGSVVEEDGHGICGLAGIERASLWCQPFPSV